MRNWLLLLLFVAVFLSSGFFTVDEREEGIVSYPNSKTLEVYSPGIYWKLPFWGELTFVYTNMRSVHFVSSLAMGKNPPLNVKLVVNWRVTKPVTYLTYLRNGQSNAIETEIAATTVEKLNLLAKNLTEESAISESSNLLLNFEEEINRIHDLEVQKLGLTIVNVGITSMWMSQYESHVSTYIEESAVDVASPKAAYESALGIKHATDVEEYQQLLELRGKNKKFYDYFVQINQLQKTAKTKAGIPPLNQLYNK